MKTGQQLLDETMYRIGEWMEMSDNPAALVAGVLANEVIKRDEYIEYLERRLKHERINSRDTGVASVKKD